MIVLLGKSSSGKDTIQEYLKANYDYKNIVSYTTRQMRQNEIEGINYHYISKDKFMHLNSLGFFAEFTENYNNYYGVAKEDCNDESIVIVERHGLEQLKKVDDLKIKSFYLYQTHFIRLKRMINRGDKLKDIIKRIIIDDIKFFNAKKQCDYIIKVENAEDTCKTIDNIIKDDMINKLEALIKNKNIKSVLEEIR